MIDIAIRRSDSVGSKSETCQENTGARRWRVVLMSIVVVLAVLALEPSFSASGSSAGTAHAQNAVIVPGNPPLTVEVLNNTLAFTQWFLDTKFTFQQKVKFGQMLVQYWTTNNRNEIEGTILASQVYVLLPLLPEGDLRQLQAALRDSVLIQLYADQSDPNNVWILQAYQASHPSFDFSRLETESDTDRTVNAAQNYNNYMKTYNMINKTLGLR